VEEVRGGLVDDSGEDSVVEGEEVSAGLVVTSAEAEAVCDVSVA
jgi:hypothetical protein